MSSPTDGVETLPETAAPGVTGDAVQEANRRDAAETPEVEASQASLNTTLALLQAEMDSVVKNMSDLVKIKDEDKMQAVKTLIAHYPKQEKTNKKISRPFKNFPLTVCCLRKFDRRILPQPFRNLCAALILAVVMTSHLFQKLDSEILSLNSQVVR